MSQDTLKQLSHYLRRSDFSGAESAAEKALAATPDDPALLAFAAFIATRLRKSDKAITYVRRCVASSDTPARPLAQSANLLAQHRLFDEALGAARSIDMEVMTDPVVLDQLGACFTSCTQHKEAAKAYSRLVELVPHDPRCRYNLAAAQRYIGDLDAAYDNFNSVTKQPGPQAIEAAYARSLLRKAKNASNHVDELTSRLAQPALDSGMRAQLFYALGKEHEDFGHWDDAFEAWAGGAAAMRTLRPYSVEPEIEAMQATADAWREQEAEKSVSDLTPVFIVSLPRAGSTLLDRILSSHGKVVSADETEDFIVSLLAEIGPKSNLSPSDLARKTTNIDISAVGERYRETLHRRGHTSGYVIDKTPTNFLYVGLIAEALPEARIIEVRRDPKDALLATFKTLFRDRYFWSYDLKSAARYIIAQRELMDHWHQGWARRIEKVDYESLVENTEAETRRLLRYLELDWDPACLKPQDNASAVATASAEHVRKPVYSSSVGKWRQFECQLQPALDLFSKSNQI